MDEDKVFLQAHMRVQKIAEDLVSEGISPLAVAGIFQALATQMYRNMLDDDEFKSLMKTVIDTSRPVTEKVYH